MLILYVYIHEFYPFRFYCTVCKCLRPYLLFHVKTDKLHAHACMHITVRRSHGSMDGCWRRGTDVIRGSRDYDREKRRRKAEKQKRDQSHRKSHTTHSECNTRTPHALKQKRAGQHEKELEEKKKEGEKDDFLDLRIHNTENDDDGDGNGMVEGDKVKEEENSLWTHFDRLYIGQKGEVSDDNITTANNSSDIYEGRRDDTTETANCSKVNMHRYWYNPNLRLIEKERQRVAERRRKENEEEKKKIRSHASPLPLSSFARSATSVTDTSTSSSMSDFTSFSTDSPSSATNMHLPSLIVERPLREILHDRVVCYVARAFHGTYPGPGTFRRFVVRTHEKESTANALMFRVAIYTVIFFILMRKHYTYINMTNTYILKCLGVQGEA